MYIYTFLLRITDTVTYNIDICSWVTLYVGDGGIAPLFLTSALDIGELSASRPSRFTPGTRWIGGWVGPRDGLGDLEKRKFLTQPGPELRPLGRPVRSQSLYRLSYPDFLGRYREEAIFLPLPGTLVYSLYPLSYTGSQDMVKNYKQRERKPQTN
jgi:hypothetical protein